MALHTKYNGLEIAITGISGKFPGSGDCRQLWKNLKEGKELIRTFSDEELRKAGVREADILDSRYVKSVGVVDGKEYFDPAFFGYNAEEASLMDPQIRLFHEHCWQALEDAGYTSVMEKYKIGVYAGASCNDNWRVYTHGRSVGSPLDPFYINMITAHRFISTLVSYKLNLRGPSVFIDTACSTSLVAVHLACRGLITRDCSVALVGGISLKSLKSKGYLYEEGMVSSNDGHCRTFDADAGGTASGEGSGVVVLKRLSEAIKDNDHIYAVIRSSAVNNDGNLKVGYTAPSVNGQVDCIKTALQLADIDPHTITYVEAHGTATKLGDPIEVRALNEAFGTGGEDKYCALGSIKSNMGHLDAAAGIAGLIKAAMSLRHKQIPASLNFKHPNPAIDFDKGPFYVNTQLQQWDRKGEFPRRAGVSSLGIGGTNAHLILEEAPEERETDPGREYKLLTVSARSEQSVLRYLGDLLHYLKEDPDVDTADLAYSLQIGRKHFAYRKAIVFRDREELMRLLDPGTAASAMTGRKANQRQIVFMFSGAGSQYANMGKDLYAGEPVFRAEMDKGFALLQRLTGTDYKDIFYSPEPGNLRINDMLHTQPSVFIFEYALARLMMSYGITPSYMIGHSLGEYVAACLSGVFSYEDALYLIVRRGQLMSTLDQGTMLSAAIPKKQALTYLDKEVSLAAVNGPEQVVFSGNTPALDRLATQLDSQGISFSKLHATHAGHSYMMDPILEPYQKEVTTIKRNLPEIPFISCLTGQFITGEECLSTEYWVRHMRETVLFADGISAIDALDKDFIFIETGGSNALTTLLKQQETGGLMLTAFNLVRHPKEIRNDLEYLTARLGQLWIQGISMDWALYYKNERRRKIPLPAYSFDPVKYPAEVDPFEDGGLPRMPLASPAAVASTLENWIYYPSWKRVAVHSPVEQPLPGHELHSGPGPQPGQMSWLVFSCGEDFSTSLKNAKAVYNGRSTALSGSEWIEVLMGKEYRKVSRNQYIIDPLCTAHFSRLMEELKQDQVTITDVIYSWGMAAEAAGMELSPENKAINLAYFSVVRILQALSHINGLQKVRMVILTDSLHKVTGTENTNYAQSLLLGLTKGIQQEYAISCRNLDLDGSGMGKNIPAGLLEDIADYDSETERIVAFRNGYRWIPCYEGHNRPIRNGASRIRRGGTYLVTGGLGNVGFILSEYLVRHYDARVILAGRRDIGSEMETNENRAKNRFSYLKEISQSTQYYRGDVSNLTDLQRMVKEIEASSGPIRGVIHTAGVTDDKYFELIGDTTPEKTLAMFAPKVDGIRNLYTIFKDKSLDFVWVTSSLAAVLGGLSNSAYASANSFMEHFITSLSEESDGWKCIGLEGLSFTSGERSESEVPKEIYQLFEWSLTESMNPVILQTRKDLAAKIEKSHAAGKQTANRGSERIKSSSETDNGGTGVDNGKLHTGNVGAERVARLARPDLNTPYMKPTTATEKRLTEIFEKFFAMEGIGIEDHFFELGGDSLKGMVLLKRVNTEFGVNLPLRELLTNATIRLISEKIDEAAWLKAGHPMKNEITI